MGDTQLTVERRGPVLLGAFSSASGVASVNEALLAQLDLFCERIEDDHTIVAAILTGSGRSFLIGSDLAQIEAGLADPLHFRRYLLAFNETMSRLERLPVPLVAAVNGLTRAGGLEVVLVCDLAVIAEDARIGDGHSAQHAIPAGGSTQRLPRRIGVPRAKDLIWSGRFLSAQEAVDWGLCQRVVPAAEVLHAAEELLAPFLDKPRPCLSEIKRLIAHSEDLGVEAGAELEMAAFLGYVRDYPFVREGVTAFRQRRTRAGGA